MLTNDKEAKKNPQLNNNKTPKNTSLWFGLLYAVPAHHAELLASCLTYGQPFRHTSSLQPTPILLTACTHFGTRLGAFFY